MISINTAALKRTKMHEYAARFLFGGVCTVIAGLIAKRYGPLIGGLFLAYPAIFPASISLIENHEKERKAEIGVDGTNRGRMEASIDSAGTALGCVGLLAFSFTLWIALPRWTAFLAIAFATVLWTVVSVSLWLIRRSRILRLRKTHRNNGAGNDRAAPKSGSGRPRTP